jgi:hypothetical protein
MTVKWITPAGNLGTYTERVTIDLPLQAISTLGIVSYSLISGKLPRGLRLMNGRIKGSPTEVRVFTTSRFVIRASDGVDIEDRTFSITIDGDDVPEWITREGFLNVGPNNAFFVLDNSRVDFQLEVRDPDLTAGDKLEFFLIPSGGELPPGLSLSRSGRISGFTDPIFALEYTESPTGAYDAGAFDIIPLDVSATETNGFDSYIYDIESYDFNESGKAPRRLSRFYTFIVGVSDGIHEIRRVFRIWVVTEEFLKADNTIIQVDTNLFQADSGDRRIPIWITESYLGRIRANNYVTIFLDVYDPPTLPGNIVYFLLSTNPGVYKLKSTGQIITNGNYEIGGEFPSFNYELLGDWSPSTTYIVGDGVQFEEDSIVGIRTWVCIKEHTNQVPSEGEYWTNVRVRSDTRRWESRDPRHWEVITPETVSELPPGMTIDNTTGEIAGRVPYQTAITKNYQFTVQAVNFPPILFDENYILLGDWNATTEYELNQAVRYENFVWLCIQPNKNRRPEEGSAFWDQGVSTVEKTFSVDIIGEIESAISWISDSDLGTLIPNLPCDIRVEAESFIYGGRTIYELVSGELPPGLELISNGFIQGKVRQFGDANGPGLIRFYEKYIIVNNIIGFTIDDTIQGTTSGAKARIFRIIEEEKKIYFNYEPNVGANSEPFLENEIISNDRSTSTIINVSRDFGNSTYDGNETSFDRRFRFQVKARDYSNVAENIKEFFIDVAAERNVTFANLYAKAFQSKEKRLSWYNFITDNDIFRENEIYRYGDPNFGIQTELKMLIYAGIESVEAQYFVSAMGRNHYNKQVRFGDVKYAVAKNPTTQAVLYEVIYVDVIDEYEKNGKSISSVIELSDKINSRVLVSYDAIKIDSDVPLVSDRDHQRIFPNSYKNMRKRIQNIGERDREFLPLWMRSIQPGSFVEPGYTKSVVLAYVKPGFSPSIISRIKSRGFDFKSMNFTIDRYLIDAINGQLENKYLAFPQRGEKLP